MRLPTDPIQWPAVTQCPDCRQPELPKGIHAVSCNSNKSVVPRHNFAVRAIQDLCQRMNLSTRLEARINNTNVRPGDLVITCPEEEIWVDVSYINPASSSSMDRAASAAVRLGASRYLENRKTSLYSHCFPPDEGKVFVPFAIETYGAIGRAGLGLIRDLMTRMAHRPGALTFTQAELRNQFLASLDVSTQRMNASAIMRRDCVRPYV